MGAGLGPGGGTNPRPRSARNRRPSGTGSGARQGWGAAWRTPWERVTVGWGPVGAGRGSDGAGERASVDARLGWRGAGDGVGGSYSLKLASIAATRSFSASMSCWFTSSIFCKSAGEAFST